MYSKKMARSIKGRGALSNPAGRFNRTRTDTVDDGWYKEEDSPPSLPTSVEPDRARSIITSNDSPDIGFDYSINPYRGCSHSCVYCVKGETLVLMGDGRARAILDVRAGDEIYGTQRVGSYRRYVKTRVLAHWSTIKPAYRTTLEDGTELVTSGDHRLLTDRGWRHVSNTPKEPQRAHLTSNTKLLGTGAFAAGMFESNDYRRGYLCGIIRGDGHLSSYVYRCSAGGAFRRHQFRLAICDQEALMRTQEYLCDYQIATSEFLCQAAVGERRGMRAIGTHSLTQVEDVRALITWPTCPTNPWMGGFLAGIFDAEARFSRTILSISNTDAEIIEWLCHCLRAFRFAYVIEQLYPEGRKPLDVVRITGGLREHLRFVHTVRPAITRKLDFCGQAIESDAPLRVVSIEPLGTMRLYDITTGTEDFIANGLISHNCYARPSHAYMGLSSGLDFETRLFYKADAARLLRSELAKPGYLCKPIAMGSNTDPYQPLEKSLEVTRQILEVLTECLHPVTIVTKSTLVLRDLELLQELARHGLASVTVSLTTLDPEIKRTLEPGAAGPQARLRVIEHLSSAGIPVGVLIAPVIPAITDHELEDLVATAAGAGARSVGYVLLRLPYEVKTLFREWLTEHHPLRAERVMSLVQAMRGGRDNDPRFGFRMRGTGAFAELLRARFELACKRSGVSSRRQVELDTTIFQPPRLPQAQLDLDL